MSARIYQFENFQIDERERLLACDGQVIPLRSKVFDTLCILARNAGRLMEKDELMKTIWPGISVEENNLQHNLSVLRKVFRQHHNSGKIIETVSRHGYRFVAEVHAIDSSAGNAPEPGRPSSLILEKCEPESQDVELLERTG